MSAQHFGAYVRLGAIALSVSACSGSPSGNGVISASGGAAGSTNTNVTGGKSATGGSATGGSNVGGTGGSSTTGGTSTAGTAAATIVPLYSYPTESPWSAIVSAKLAHPRVTVIAIANVDDGPGTAVDSEFTSGIRSLTSAGIVVIGYVYTSYAARAAATVKADIDAWHRFYPAISGIFFDEESNDSGGDAYYRDLATYAKSNGMTLTVGNPGTDTSSAYINAMDVTFIYESAGLPSTNMLTGWRSSYARSRAGVIPYAANLDLAWVQQARAAVGYIYVTNDDLPNPWDTLPSYFSSLLAALE
jgi:hypothetical protein